MHQSDPSSINTAATVQLHSVAGHLLANWISSDDGGAQPADFDLTTLIPSSLPPKLNSSLLKSHRAPKGKYYSLSTGAVFIFGYIIVKLFPMLTGSLSMATGGDGTNITN